jgi:hypothetical protein
MQPYQQPNPYQQQYAGNVAPAYPSAPVPGAYPMLAPAAPGMPGGDQFNSPTRVINVVRPRIMDIGPGRLLILRPTKIERGIKNDLAEDPNAVQDRLTADVVVLDGPPFPYGGKPEIGQPHTHNASIPMEWPGLWLTQDLIVRQCEKSIGGMVLGRLVLGQASKPGRRPPWRLDDPTDSDKVIARQYLAGAAVAAASAPAPVAPVPTTMATYTAPPVDPGYAAWLAAQAQTGYPVGGGVPTMAQHTVPAPPMPQPNGPYGPPTAAQQYIGSPDPGAQYPPPAPPMPALDIDTPPAGMDPAMWASMPPEMRAAVAASAAGRAPWQ